MNKREVIIIGGGASGLMCAMVASKSGVSVTVLEADFKIGKKILVSGNGRCNFTNTNVYANSYNDNINNYLTKFNFSSSVEFFNNLGLISYADSEGRMYPKSNLSSSVLDVMHAELDKNKVEVITGVRVESVKKQNNEYVLQTSGGEYYCKKLVLACGSNVLTNIFKELNLGYEKFTPSLCALKVSNNVRDLSGIRISNVQVTLNYNNTTVTEQGEILFKDGGVSGICVMNLSAYLARAHITNAKLSINLLPDYDYNDLFTLLTKRKNNLKHLTAKQFFVGMFHKNVGIELLNRAKISLSTSVKSITQEQLELLSKIIQNFSLDVIGFYDNNQVFNGGVNLSELTENLESKNNANFYVCGEACNVDGLCGGYNLQWAWTSGYIVGNKLSKND